MEELRARVISQERDLYRVKSEKGEIFAEVSGKFRYETGTVSDYPAVGDYVLVNWPDDGSSYLETKRQKFKEISKINKHRKRKM